MPLQPVGSASLALDLQGQNKPDASAASPGNPPKKPIIICAANGYNYLDRGYAVLAGGGDTLDAVMQVITGPEDDPNDDSVGLGGLPNEDCVVELDACCMHGPTRMAGSVAAVREIKNVSLLSKAVMEHTGHVMLVGEGAQRFGFDMGFPRENLLTDRSRKIWLLWKETMSNKDWWGPGLASPNYKLPDETPNHSELREERMQKMEELAGKLGIEPEFRAAAVQRVLQPPTGTINCSAINEKGEMSGATTTSGLAWKLAGRAGDSPIIGAGCYTRSGCRLGGRDRQRRREHQGLRRAHHRRKHAARDVAAGSRHGRAEAHRAQLQRRYAQDAVRRHELLHPAQRRRLCWSLHVERSARSFAALCHP